MRMSIAPDPIRRAMNLYTNRRSPSGPAPDLTASLATTVNGRRYVILRNSPDSTAVLAVYRMTPTGRLMTIANGERIVRRAGLAK